jgi:hypothetical protein
VSTAVAVLALLLMMMVLMMMLLMLGMRTNTEPIDSIQDTHTTTVEAALMQLFICSQARGDTHRFNPACPNQESSIGNSAAASIAIVAAAAAAAAVPGRRLWLLSCHNFVSTYYAPLLFRPLSYLRGLRALFGEYVF